MIKIRVLCAALALAATATVLSGCAVEIKPPPRTDVFVDSAFKPPSVRIDVQEALALSPAMKRFADTEMASEIRNKGLRDGLIDALYTKGRLQLDYDAEVTRTAAEAFDARRGNCMSLVLMTAAFARHLNMPVRFNSVFLEESWTRSNGIFFVAGHVGQVDDAYWWAREAIRTDSRWLSAYNTLAVLYRRKGLMDRAEATLRLVLEREPLNTQAMSNLILVLSDTGRRDEALAYSNQLAQIQPVPPYKFFDEGVAAMRAGEYAAARQLFRKELARAAYVPEFHFWLGLANYGMGDVTSARGEIAKALENSATLKDREMYGAKLAWLNEMREQQRQRIPIRGAAGS
jgi:Tfp pilus assembly protein PilF